MSTDNLKSLLKKYPSLSYDKQKGKVRCSLSGHEMPCREDVINSYVNGKKFLKLVARDDRNYEKYKPHLVPSTKRHHEHQLFCMLTLTHINKTPVHVERHVNGGKYKRCLARWKECQKTGKEYRPPRRRRKEENPDTRKGKKSVDGGGGGGEEDEGDTSDVDSLSDLYPAAEDNEGLEASGSDEADESNDSDFEFEDMEEDVAKETPASPETEPRGQKRNKVKGGRNHRQKTKKIQKTS